MNAETQEADTADDVDADLTPEERYAAKQAREALVHANKAPIDQAFRRPSDRPNTALPPSLFDAIEPAMQPSMTLDPQQIRSHEQFELQQAWGCEPAVQAMEALHKAATDLIAAREAIKTDVTLTEAAQLLAVDDLHSKLSKQALSKVTPAVKNLEAAILTAEQSLRASIKESAVGPFSAEIRSMVRGMSLSERQSFMSRCVTQNDSVALGAILGAPSYLSGLDATMAQTLTERVNLLRQPQTASRLALMQHAKAKLEEAAGAWMRGQDQLVGSRSSTVERLRAHKAKLQKVIGAIAPVA